SGARRTARIPILIPSTSWSATGRIPPTKPLPRSWLPATMSSWATFLEPWFSPSSVAMSLSQPTTHRVLRIAHLTDIHIYPEPRASQGLTACLRHVHALADPPDVIFNGGDAIMDALEIDEERTRAQWDAWQQILRAECRLPIEHCLGNHDVWGWHRAH